MNLQSIAQSLIEALTAHMRQADRFLRLSTVDDRGASLLPGSTAGQSFVPESVEIAEHMAKGGYQMRITAVSLNAHADLHALMGTPLLLELLTAFPSEQMAALPSLANPQTLAQPPAPPSMAGRSATQRASGSQSGWLRPFHGHITHAERVGSNGGLARYQFTVQPWLGFLAHRRDSHLWVDKSVVEIIEDVFSDYADQGSLNPQFRWELADRSIYPSRGLTVQFEESDLNFIERLLAEEGIAYHFEHLGDASSPSLGSHTLVMADHNDAYPVNAQSVVRYHRAHATEREDSIQAFHPQAAWKPTALNLASWDYKSLSQRPISALGNSPPSGKSSPLTLNQTKGHYGYPNSQQGDRHAQQALEALQTQAQSISGHGVMRSLSPGSWFSLIDHPRYGLQGIAQDGGNRFIALAVTHRAKNNFQAELGQGLESLLGKARAHCPLPSGEGRVRASQSPAHFLSDLFHGIPAETSVTSSTPAPPSMADRSPEKQSTGLLSDPGSPLYQNHFTVLPAQTPLRLPAQPQLKPIVQGSQTAIVVGPEGAQIHTDRDHRIHVQFHWQRGSNGSSRQAHPASGGSHDNAPGTNSQSVWLRLRTDLAGANWGSVAIPRVGQEVLIHCLDGDPDRPLVTGSLYNGQGQADAQGNQTEQGAGSSTGNAPAWFAGEVGAHAHPAVLSGLYSQSLDTSQQGGGGANHLLFDASPNQARISLGSSQHQSSLSLGHLKQQQGNARKADRGHGFELSTQASGVIKAGQGLLLTTEAASPHQAQLHSPQANATLEQAKALSQALAESAGKQVPKGKAAAPSKVASKPAPSSSAQGKSAAGTENLLLPSTQAQAQLLASLSQTTQGQSSPIAGGGQGTVPAWSAPHLLIHGQAGLVALTPANLHQTAGQTHSLSAGADLNRLAQGSQTLSAKDGLTLYTVGQLSKDSEGKAQARVIKEVGLKLHAATGPVSLQAQSDQLKLNAQKVVNLSSVTGNLSASAKSKLTLTAKGAAVTIEGGNITVTAPGAIKLHGAKKNLTSGKSGKGETVAMKKAGNISAAERYDEQFEVIDESTGTPLPRVRYDIVDDAGKILASGVTDAKGRTRRVYGPKATKLHLIIHR